MSVLSRCFVSGLLVSMVWFTPAEAAKRYALVVAVKTYRPNQQLDELPFTENDGTGLAKVLEAGGYQVTLMTQTRGREPGKDAFQPLSDYVRDQLDALLSNPFLKDEDVVLVALAGHGVQFEFVEGEKKTPRFYFCPADAEIAKLRTANEITDRNNLLDLSELYDALAKCKAGGKLLLVDACRNDPSKPKLRRSALASLTLPPLAPPPGGIAAFFSCSAHQEAVEDPDLKHGVFFHHVIEALSGDADSGTAKRPADGQITLAELSEYVSSGTYDFVRKKYNGAKQAPELKGEFRLSVPLISVATSETIASISEGPTSTGSLPSIKIPHEIEGTKAGERRLFTSLEIPFRWCPAGTFTMGSPKNEADRNDDEDQVEVTLTKGYWLAETELTQGQWLSVQGTSPWKGQDYVKEGADYPATYLSHRMGSDGRAEKDSALELCRKLTERERSAGRLPSGWAYQLPTEAEWEYACRAGTKTMYGFGDGVTSLGDYAWYNENTWDVGQRYAHLVGQKRGNDWGLLDMHGNVWEWCSDWQGSKLEGGRDPQGDASGFEHVRRGGGWDRKSESCRSANRGQYAPGYRSMAVGFRVALVPAR